jgi:RNA polymerase sigma-70 factor (ECF subfamily)
MALEEQVRQLLAGGDDGGAATAVIDALGPAILRYLRAVLRDEGDAGDGFSQWAENVWQGLPAFRFGSSLKTWSYRLARNVAVNLRDEAWRRRGQRLATGQASALAASIRTRSVLVVERRRQVLDELRATLDEEEQSLLTLRLDHELPWSEVAVVMAGEGTEVDPATLMKRFERIKLKLGKLARERGLLGEG